MSSTRTTPLAPGGTLGILGGGQLAQMMIAEARRLGFRAIVLDPDLQCPAAQLADRVIQGGFDDPRATQRLADHADVITLDTEHVPAEILERLDETKPVRPAPAVFRTVQDRLEQRRFLEKNGFPQTRFRPVDDAKDLQAAVSVLGLPAVLKTRREGYDGKGQVVIRDLASVNEAWDKLGRRPAVLEAFVAFEKEISALVARDLNGGAVFFPVAENEHRHHVLHKTYVPARVPASVAAEAQALGLEVARALGHVGMMALELFVSPGGRLLINEIAPRTHNSGHFTLGACVTSQFEQHVRAVAGLPLGETRLLSPAVMLNLLGDLWANGEPDWNPVLSSPGARLHLYGKARARPGRKMGHVLVLAEHVERASDRADVIARALERGARLEARDPA